MNKETKRSPASGYFMLFLILFLAIVTFVGFAVLHSPIFSVLIFVILFLLSGFMVINPNESVVLILFGEYKGTVKVNGFFWVNPFFRKVKISLRARNFDNQPIKVNDKIGNPVLIGIVLVWKVENTYKAAFDVDNYEHFVQVQTEAAIRKLAEKYPYDNFDDEQKEVTLRSGGEVVNHALEAELAERLEIAGIHVIESRISHLAYAQEIAGAMLQRQQATAIVAARFKIVEGAVEMVKMALEQLEEKNIAEMDTNAKAAMASNLMVVLTSDKAATPIVNAGYQNK